MSYLGSSKSGTARYGDALCAVAAVAVCSLMLTTSGFAQTAPAPAAPAKDAAKAPAAGAAAGAAAAAAPAAAAGNQSSWVKLCDKVTNTAKDKDGKETKTEKNVCATFHDTIDANSGMTVVSAAMREVEGDAKPDLQVTVPLGMIIPAGARVSVLSKEQSEKLKKGEEIDPKAVKQVDLKFTACLPNGCTAEIQAPDEILAQMKLGGALLVRSIYVSGQPFSVPVPLQGFDTALAGKAVDNDTYKKARTEMMTAINARRQQQFEELKKKAAAEVPPPPGQKPGEAIAAEKKAAPAKP